MFQRHILLTVVLCVAVSPILPGPSLAPAQQQQPTAGQLFDVGMQQYADGNYAAAQQTFRRVDPLQLNKKQRLIMYETLQNIDRNLRRDTTPAATLDEARKAQNRGKLSEAMALYQAVADHPAATADQKKRANASIAEIKRRLNDEVTRARQSIDQAAADIRDGRYLAAERKLRAVKESGLDLGWFENERIDRQLLIIAERTAAQRQEPAGRIPDQRPTVTDVPVPPAPPSDQADRENQLDQWQQQVDQLEDAQRQEAQEVTAVEPPTGPSDDENRRRQAQLEQELAQQQRQLDERQRLLEEQARVQHEEAQRAEEERRAQWEKELAQKEQELAQRQQQLEQQLETQRQQTRLEQERSQRWAQWEAELARERQAEARRQQQLAQQPPLQHDEPARQEPVDPQQDQWKQQMALRQQQLAEHEQQLEQQLQLQQIEQSRLEQEQQRRRQQESQLAEQERQLAQRHRDLVKAQPTQPEPSPPPMPMVVPQHEPWVPQPDIQGGVQDSPLGVTGVQDEPPAPEDILSQARRFHAQEKLAQARNARQAQQYDLAAKLYREVLQLDPNIQEAQESLALVQTKVASTIGPRGVLDTEIEARTIRTNAAIAEFQELMTRAAGLMANEAFAAARESVQQAKITLDLNQRFLPASRYRTLRDNAVNLAAKIADAERTVQEAQKRELELVRRTEAEKRRAEAILAQQQETQRLLQRAADLRREQKYEQAMELLNQALFLDPNNIAAQAMKEMIEESQLYVEARNRMRQRSMMVSHQSSDNIDATTPFTELMTYPPDWPRLTAARLAGLDPGTTESEANRRVALKLRDSVPINFENNKLVNIIEYLRNTTGVNFFVNWPVLETIGVSKDLPITLQLVNVPVDQALRLILQQSSAGNEVDPIGFSIIEGVVTVSTERDLAKTTDIRPYDIRDLLVQVPNFDDAPEFDLNVALSNTNSGGSNPSVSGGGGAAGGGGGIFATPEDVQEQPTREQLIEQIIGLVQDTVGKQEDWEIQGGQGSIRELNGNLIVKSTPKNHRQIAQLLAQLRETRAIQIAVEGRFLIVDQNFLDEIGVDLDIQIGTDSSKWGPVLIGQDTSGLTPRPGNTGAPGSFTTFDTTPGITTFTTTTDAMGNTITTNVPFGGSPTNPAQLSTGTQSGAGFQPSGRSFDFGFSYLDDLQVNLMVTASQASRRAITLTAPRLTLFNGQRAFVVVARQTSFVSDLEPIPDSGGFDPTLSVTQSGVILDVEATVSSDRRYVTMTVRPSLSTLIQLRPIRQTGLASVSSTDPVTGQVVLAPVSAFIEAPEVELTSIKTSVSVPDRGTLLLGGQRIVADIDVEAGVPVLSKIPVLNRLFTSTSTVKDERNLLILIKPTIIIQSEEEEQTFPGLLQDPQKFGVGHRF